MSLSPREQRILAGIENELGEKDPALAATFTQARLPASFWQRFPLSARHTCLLVLALLTLVVLHRFALELGAVGLGILTGALIVPWIISASRAAGRRYGEAPRAPRTGPAVKGLLRWRGM
jgi:hypothetical protein